jgi:hypothetical protein
MITAIDMKMLNSNGMNIIDLPDEILLSIMNKLNNIDVLYSLVDVNQRFDRLTLHSLYFRHLDFLVSSFHDVCEPQKYYQIINRICQNISPRFHHQMNELTLEHISMKHVLHTFNFSHIHSSCVKQKRLWNI